MAESTGLVVIWTTREREVALSMALAYAKNARQLGLWEAVRLLIWGPSAKVLACDLDLQDAVAACRQAGVDVVACRDCVADYGVTDQFERLGLTLVDGNIALTDDLKAGWNVVSV